MDNDFGKFLSEKRKEIGLTQKELADKLFVSESAVSKWERNKANPDISMINELSQILKVSEHELISASVDIRERKIQNDAKKWRNLSLTWNLFFIISYAMAIIICFICDLAIDGKLSWFWIVFLSILLSMSFTIFPKYIKKYKLLFNTLIPFICLVLLFLVCNIYTNSNWFFITTIPCLFAFSVVFLPIYIKKYNLPNFIKKHNALISILIDYIFLVVTLLVICFKTNGKWFGNFAFPLSLLLLGAFLFFVCVCHYIKFPKLIKSSILVFFFLPYLIISYFVVKKLCLNEFSIEIDEIIFPDFSNWSSNTFISSNVIGIIFLIIFITSVVLFLSYFIKKKTTKESKKNLVNDKIQKK